MKILNTSIKFKEVALDVGIVVLIGAKEIPEWESNARKRGQDLTADEIAKLITNIAGQKLNSDFGSQREIVLFEAYFWILENRTGKLRDEAENWLADYLEGISGVAKHRNKSVGKRTVSRTTKRVKTFELKVDIRPDEKLGTRMHWINVSLDEDWEFKKEMLFHKMVEFGIKKEDALKALNEVRNKGQYQVEDDKGNMFFIEPV